MRRRIVAGNWKLHGTRAFAFELLDAVIGAGVDGVERIILPPLPYLGELVEHYGERGLALVRRTSVPTPRAPTPARCRPRC